MGVPAGILFTTCGSTVSDLRPFLQFESEDQKRMAGLVKAKKYQWKDSNLALFGSDLEKNVSEHCYLH